VTARDDSKTLVITESVIVRVAVVIVRDSRLRETLLTARLRSESRTEDPSSNKTNNLSLLHLPRSNKHYPLLSLLAKKIMPSQFDNMSVDENPAPPPPALSAAQNNFINVVRFGGDLPGAWGALVREMRFVPSQLPSALCDNLHAFIERNNLRRDYLERFKDCVGVDAQMIRFSLQNFAAQAGFESIEEYFTSQHQRPIMFKLGLGLDSDSNPISDLGNRVRQALRIVYAGAGSKYNLFFISFFHFHRFILCTYFNTPILFSAQAIPPTPQTPTRQDTAYANQYQYNHGTPLAGGGLSYAYANPNLFGPTPPNVYHHLPPGTPGGYSNFVPNGGHYYGHGFAGSVGSHSHAGTSFSHDPNGGQQQQQMSHSQGAHSLAHRGKENFANAPPAAYVPSHISSMRGGDAASTGMSTLSLNEPSNGAKNIEKVKDPHATMQLPEVHNNTMMDRHRMNQFVDKARKDPILATQENSVLQTDSRKHVGLDLSKKVFEEQMGIYDAEDTRFRAGIDDADCKTKNDAAAHGKRMADMADEETEELRAAEAKITEELRAAEAKIKAKFADKKAKEEKDFARKKRESDDEVNEWKEKKEKNKREKEENLTLAKAKLLSFEIGTEIFASLSQLESNQENPEFLNGIDYAISRLDQYRDLLSRTSDNEPGAEEAMELLKSMVWDDHTEL